MKYNLSRNSKASKKRQRVALLKRSTWAKQNVRAVKRQRREASHLLDLIFMPYFWIMDEFILTLRDIFNVS